MKTKDPKEIELVYDAMQEPAQIARYLRAIADGLEARKLHLRSGERAVELHPGNLCTFELRSTTERQRVKLQLQLAWREAREGGEHVLEIVSE